MEKPKKPITKAGFIRLADEHHLLSKIERPKVLDGIQVAAAEGDRSENAEYIYGRKRLRELDKRIRYLNQLLTDTEIIDPDDLRGDIVCFAATVQILDEENETHDWTIVGTGEADLPGLISWRSPVAKALLGKKIGDIVVVQRPKGEGELEIVNLRFGQKPWVE